VTKTERETGEAIVRAAAELFAERGYKGTTTRAIAERAGVNEVTLFRRFGNKQGILRGLGEMWAARMTTHTVSSTPDPTDVAATLRALAHTEVAQAAEFGAASMRLAMDATSNPELAEIMKGGPGDNLASLTAYMADRQAAGALRADLDPRVLAEGFFLLTSTLVMSRQLLGPAMGTEYGVPAEVAVDQLVELYLRGAIAGGAPAKGVVG
jgi:AcrR family transcriptional regulator